MWIRNLFIELHFFHFVYSNIGFRHFSLPQIFSSPLFFSFSEEWRTMKSPKSTERLWCCCGNSWRKRRTRWLWTATGARTQETRMSWKRGRKKSRDKGEVGLYVAVLGRTWWLSASGEVASLSLQAFKKTKEEKEAAESSGGEAVIKRWPVQFLQKKFQRTPFFVSRIEKPSGGGGRREGGGGGGREIYLLQGRCRWEMGWRCRARDTG